MIPIIKKDPFLFRCRKHVMIFLSQFRSLSWKPIFKMPRLKRRWMPTKSIGTVRAGYPPRFRFATEAIAKPIKHRLNFPSRLKPISGCADADDRVENPTATDHTNKAKTGFPSDMRLTAMLPRIR